MGHSVTTFLCVYNCLYFNDGSSCSFNDGSSCSFNDGSSCSFNDGSSCSFNDSSSCSFNDSKYVISTLHVPWSSLQTT